MVTVHLQKLPKHKEIILTEKLALYKKIHCNKSEWHVPRGENKLKIMIRLGINNQFYYFCLLMLRYMKIKIPF